MNATNRTILLYDVFAPPSHPNHPSLAPQEHPPFLIATTGHRFSLPVKSLPLTRNDITSGQRFTPRTESLLKDRSISDLSLPRPGPERLLSKTSDFLSHGSGSPLNPAYIG